MNNRIILLSIFILLIIKTYLFCNAAIAQLIKPEFKSNIRFETDKEKEKEKEQLKLKEQQFSLDKLGLLEPTAQALEAAINPAEYIVGPGDIFYINIIGEDFLPSPIMVTPEGKLVIPSIGTFDVDGKTLADVKKVVLEEGKKRYISNPVIANLIQMRNVRVYVLGEVEIPGTYMAQPIDRVSVMIDRAGGITDWANEQKISIRHIDGSEDTCDLSEFYHKANLQSNRFVQGGDVIYVPPLNLSKKTVTIDGIMEKSGIYQIIDGETVDDFLLRVDALNRKVMVSDIYLIRNSTGQNKRIIKLNLLGNDTNQTAKTDLVLEDKDIIYAPSIKDYVYVAGAVQSPGSYPFFVGFRAIDYVGIAGGTMEMGRIKGIKTVRESTQKVEKGADVVIQRGDTVIVPTTFRKKLSEYIGLASSLTTIGLFILALQK